jgi:uncharacterized protein (DUF305 family)
MPQLIGIVIVSLVVAAMPSAQSASSAKPRITDGDFARLMAKHHQGGIEMAKLEETAGSADDVKRLATAIRVGQERDLPELNAAAKRHAATAALKARDAAMQKEHMAMMEKMKAAKGIALDQAFLSEMIKHHESGLAMIAETQFTDDKLKAVADKMAAHQRGEIDQMKKLQR